MLFQATLKADVAGYEISTVVSTSELNITKGKVGNVGLLGSCHNMISVFSHHTES